MHQLAFFFAERKKGHRLFRTPPPHPRKFSKLCLFVDFPRKENREKGPETGKETMHLKFPNTVGRRNTQMSADERKRAQTQICNF